MIGENTKPRVGIFIDAGNLYHTSARSGVHHMSKADEIHLE